MNISNVINGYISRYKTIRNIKREELKMFNDKGDYISEKVNYLGIHLFRLSGTIETLESIKDKLLIK